MIEFDEVTKLYGTVIGVNDVTLSLGPGAHGLLGPNGAGKTTFLNLVTGQLRPTTGTVKVFDMLPDSRASVHERLGVCPGDEAFYGNVTGYDWVRFLLELHGLSVSDAALRAADTMALVGMREAMHRTIGSYSRGMRQRTKLAQAFAHDPDLLILDEPFAGLDPVGRHAVTDLLRGWVEEGRNLILASHILHEVEAVTPSFVLICGGRLLASGRSDEIQELLVDLPNEIRIRCNDARALAKTIMVDQTVSSVEVTSADALTVSTRSPLALYNELPEWINGNGIEVYELQSATDTLQSLFDSLMRVHRGE